MPEHQVGTREEWEAAREELGKREDEHAQRSEELAQQRRAHGLEVPLGVDLRKRLSLRLSASL